MTNTATITKTQGAQPAGTYCPTSVDVARAVADIRVVGFVGSKVEIMARKALSGRGVALMAVGAEYSRYEVTERALDALRATHSIYTDF